MRKKLTVINQDGSRTYLKLKDADHEKGLTFEEVEQNEKPTQHQNNYLQNSANQNIGLSTR